LHKIFSVSHQIGDRPRNSLDLQDTAGFYSHGADTPLREREEDTSMHITILGAGGVGGYFGARLAQGGADVGFVARGEQLTALQKSGLRVESKLGDIHLPQVRASNDPAALGPTDVVLICVKLWDTEAAASAVKPMVGPDTAVISLQNGAQKDDILRRVLGDRAVMGGVCYIGSRILRPGVIAHTGTLQKLVFGEYDGAASSRANAFLEACQRGGIDVEMSTNIRLAIWEKFVFLTGFSAVTTTMHSPIGPIRDHPKTRAFLLDIMREVVAVGRAQGVPLPERFAEDRLAFYDTLPADMTSSMYNDLEQGRRLEVEWLSGGVAELGKAAGIATPLNRAVNDILALRAGVQPSD
jgi:2-dehydropantoate 2-reductase